MIVVEHASMNPSSQNDGILSNEKQKDTEKDREKEKNEKKSDEKEKEKIKSMSPKYVYLDEVGFGNRLGFRPKNPDNLNLKYRLTNVKPHRHMYNGYH